MPGYSKSSRLAGNAWPSGDEFGTLEPFSRGTGGEDGRQDPGVLRPSRARLPWPKPVPDGLLNGAAKVFAQASPDDCAPLLDLIPATTTDGAALLRMLDAAGAIDGMADGTLTPSAGLAGWISEFFGMYCYVEAPTAESPSSRCPLNCST